MNQQMLASVMCCADCGRLYATRFHSYQPVSSSADVPDHVDVAENMTCHVVESDACECGGRYFYRLALPTPSRIEAVEDPGFNLTAWGDK